MQELPQCATYQPSCRQSDKYVEEALELSAFRRVEKRYKLFRYDRRTRRRMQLPPTDFSDVVDFSAIEANTAVNRALISEVECFDGVQRVECYTLKAVPGLFVFPSYVSEADQQELCRDAILKYANSEYHPNHLSMHASEPRQTARYEPPMRWATLGFSYQWSTKSYKRDCYSSFPAKLRDYMKRIASLCNGPVSYQPQTSIVNYFPVGTMMMAHQDLSEETLDQPLISISLGCSCVFLIGTTSREDAPHAIWLRSGDVLVMCGESRMAFHGVPRVMDDCPRYLTLSETVRDSCDGLDGSEGDYHEDKVHHETEEVYWRRRMQHLRININARQVYAEDLTFLFD